MAVPDSPAQQSRLAFLDTLRAVAALSVLIAHMGSELWPGFQQFRFGVFDLGSFGVTLFFICSGFIIPPSIERASSLGSFWRRRFYRLYPLYWFSVLSTAAIIVLDLARPTDLLAEATPATILLNLTMIQSFFGAPHLQVVYWSLTFELLFYLVFTAFFIAKVNQYSTLITIGLIGVTLIVEVVSPLLGGPQVPLNMSGFLVIMFSGVLFHRVFEGRMKLAPALGLALAGLVVNVAAALVDSLVQSGDWWRNLYLITAWTGSYIVFVGAYLLRTQRLLALPAPQYLGRISYSIYLVHLPIILVIPLFGMPLLNIVIWSTLSLGVSAITYRLIEEPMIARARSPRRAVSRIRPIG